MRIFRGVQTESSNDSGASTDSELANQPNKWSSSRAIPHPWAMHGWSAFVMVSALIVMFAAIRIGRVRQKPLFDVQFHQPEFNRIDAPLVIGSALFGVGWGMSGICPGPAISLIAFWPQNLMIYLLALFGGSYGGSFVIPSGRDKRLAMAQ